MADLFIAMIYERKSRSSRSATGSLYLQHERSGLRMSGLSAGGYVRLTDQQGRVWSGMAERRADDLIYYHLKDESGHSMSGVESEAACFFRDDRNETWKGFVS